MSPSKAEYDGHLTARRYSRASASNVLIRGRGAGVPRQRRPHEQGTRTRSGNRNNHTYAARRPREAAVSKLDGMAIPPGFSISNSYSSLLSPTLNLPSVRVEFSTNQTPTTAPSSYLIRANDPTVRPCLAPKYERSGRRRPTCDLPHQRAVPKRHSPSKSNYPRQHTTRHALTLAHPTPKRRTLVAAADPNRTLHLPPASRHRHWPIATSCKFTPDNSRSGCQGEGTFSIREPWSLAARACSKQPAAAVPHNPSGRDRPGDRSGT